VPIKSLAELLEGDDRQRVFGGLADWQSALAEIELASSVPEHIRALFDTARNVSLCTWFVYEFHPIAELTGFLALEAALKARAAKDSPELAEEKSFRKLMDHALAAGWIAEERIGHRRAVARTRVEDRNAMASIMAMEAQGMDSMPVEQASEEEVLAEEREMQIIDGICNAAVRIRNGLAHGRMTLDPGSYQRLRMTGDLINQIFS
jgi:hypothetical protein